MKTALTQVKVSVPADKASAFKCACAAANVSMASVIAHFMADYANCKPKPNAAPDCSTRRKRRATVKRILFELEQLKAAEERLVCNAPENLKDAPVYESADEYISALEEAIVLLGTMVP